MPLAAIADVWRSAVEPAEPSTWQDGEQVVALNLYTIKNQVDAIAFGVSVRKRIEQLQAAYAPLKLESCFSSQIRLRNAWTVYKLAFY